MGQFNTKPEQYVTNFKLDIFNLMDKTLISKSTYSYKCETVNLVWTNVYTDEKYTVNNEFIGSKSDIELEEQIRNLNPNIPNMDELIDHILLFNRNQAVYEFYTSDNILNIIETEWRLTDNHPWGDMLYNLRYFNRVSINSHDNCMLTHNYITAEKCIEYLKNNEGDKWGERYVPLFKYIDINGKEKTYYAHIYQEEKQLEQLRHMEIIRKIRDSGISDHKQIMVEYFKIISKYECKSAYK